MLLQLILSSLSLLPPFPPSSPLLSPSSLSLPLPSSKHYKAEFGCSWHVLDGNGKLEILIPFSSLRRCSFAGGHHRTQQLSAMVDTSLDKHLQSKSRHHTAYNILGLHSSTHTHMRTHKHTRTHACTRKHTRTHTCTHTHTQAHYSSSPVGLCVPLQHTTLRFSGVLAFLADSTFILYISCRSQMDTNSEGFLVEVA